MLWCIERHDANLFVECYRCCFCNFCSRGILVLFESQQFVTKLLWFLDWKRFTVSSVTVKSNQTVCFFFINIDIFGPLFHSVGLVLFFLINWLITKLNVQYWEIKQLVNKVKLWIKNIQQTGRRIFSYTCVSLVGIYILIIQKFTLVLYRKILFSLCIKKK